VKNVIIWIKNFVEQRNLFNKIKNEEKSELAQENKIRINIGQNFILDLFEDAKFFDEITHLISYDTETAFKLLRARKDLPKETLTSTLFYKALIYQKMAYICQVEHKAMEYMNYTLHSIILKMISGLLSPPDFKDFKEEVHLLQEEENYYFNQEFFREQLFTNYTNINELLSFLYSFIENHILKVIYPPTIIELNSIDTLLSYYDQFYQNASDQKILTNLEINIYQNNLPIFETASNFSGLFGYELSRRCKYGY